VADARARHRFFAESIAGAVVELPATEARHALHVLRLRGGEVVEVFDGAGGVAAGRLQPAGKKAAFVTIDERRREDRPQPPVTLAFAVPKGKRLDCLLESAVPLGVSRFAPVVFERSVAGKEVSEAGRQRWAGICLAAAKQCGASHLPEIAEPATLKNFLAAATDGLRILGDPDGAASPREALAAASPGVAVTILIGPEGGLTDAERSAAAAAGFLAVKLGGLTLRIETAALALLAVVQALRSPQP